MKTLLENTNVESKYDYKVCSCGLARIFSFYHRLTERNQTESEVFTTSDETISMDS